VVRVGEWVAEWGRALAGGVPDDTLCDRSRRDALIGEREFSNAGKVGRVSTTD